ncbi:hypothetical protein CMV_017728 [Castanea mollissima]|uniref:Cyanobacterial aminoacyl-tRNA synthetase CAAD domain-containing protein n=1 Tax=Castanea mollissima TaxID=60419 RepID=A0A8J4QX57_9ROSI|nr:hypothetical protein CMV_017728 [Castanea mollissima]
MTFVVDGIWNLRNRAVFQGEKVNIREAYLRIQSRIIEFHNIIQDANQDHCAPTSQRFRAHSSPTPTLSLSFSATTKIGMASIVANLPPPLLLHGRKTLFTTLQKVPVSSIRGFSHIAERQTRVTVIVNATGEGSESSTSLSIVKSVQNVWDKSEDRFALIGLGFAAIVAFWASVNVITAIDKLPLIPGVLEFIGILFSSWFIYRYLLFKPDREELFKIIDKSISDVLGQ